MLGTELILRKIKSYGKALMITTLTQSLGTFLIVSLVFAVVFLIRGVPVYLAFAFGGIALATAPAPALSIVQEFHTRGPVTDTLLPMAVLDDIVGIAVFFTVNACIAREVSGGAIPLYMIPVMIFLPIGIGAATGFPAGLILRKMKSRAGIVAVLLIDITCTAVIGILLNRYVFTTITLNYMLMGVSASAVFSNMITEEQLDLLISLDQPILGISLLGATATHMPKTVQKYLGLTLLPHSGVSLVFTGIICGVLQGPRPDLAAIVQGTIAAAAVINEIIAVIAAKKGFELAGEIGAAASQ